MLIRDACVRQGSVLIYIQTTPGDMRSAAGNQAAPVCPFSITMVDGTHWLCRLAPTWGSLESPQRWAWRITPIPFIDWEAPPTVGGAITYWDPGRCGWRSWTTLHSTLSVTLCGHDVAAPSGSCCLKSPSIMDNPSNREPKQTHPSVAFENFTTRKETKAQVKDVGEGCAVDYFRQHLPTDN